MRHYAVLAAILVLTTLSAKAQNAQGEYLEAKRLFNNEQYSSAKGAFGALTDDPYFGGYASFYYALSAYRQGDIQTANDMWSQLLIQRPKWKGKSEVLFWLAYVNLEKGDFDKGIAYAEKLSEVTDSAEWVMAIYETFLDDLEPDQLSELCEADSTNRNLAFIYTRKLIRQPYEERDFDEINRLNALWNFEYQDLLMEELPDLKKDSYKIGLFLPFMYDKEKPEWVIQNTVVMELYQGMSLAVADLLRQGISLELIALDTKRDQQTTASLLDNVPGDYFDLIVGPLYPGPVNVVKEYSRTNRVNMINPLSSNRDVVADNPFGFLFKPTYETMAVKLAKQADKQFRNRNAMIFYENNVRDSIIAFTYKQEIEKVGFNVVWFQELTKENAKGVLDTLIAQYEVYYTEAEADSILQLPRRFVKERRLRKDELKRLERYARGEAKWDSLFYRPISFNESGKEVTYYENMFYISQDSIGHILGATRKNHLANNLISAVETMGDSTALYGYSDWLDFTMVSYNQLQRIGVFMIHPDYYEVGSGFYRQMEKRCLYRYKTMPTTYHLQGYELMMQVGLLLNEYGVYFQNGLRNGTYFEGLIYEGIRYGAANDNQVVPIVRFEDAKLKVVNKGSYEDRQEQGTFR